MMNCISPPELSDVDLLRYLDHEASSEIASHISRCIHCQERATQLQQLQNQLSRTLHRATCPTSMELGEYHLDMLDAAQMGAIRRHVEACPHCRRELEQLSAFEDSLAPQPKPTPIRHIKVLVAQLVDSASQALDHLAGSSLSPGLAMVRNEGDEERSSVYRINDVCIVIEVQSELPQRDQKTVLGFVQGMQVDRLNVYLWRGEEPIVAVDVDEQGHFIFEHIPGGTYDLTVQDANLEVHVREVTV